MIKKIKNLLRAGKKAIKYNGSKRFCPICEKSANTFLENGSPSRKDSRCPFCSSLERHRLFWLYLKRRSKLLSNPPKSALHIAPEKILEKGLRPLIGGGYLTADLLDPHVDVKMDVSNIQYDDNYFDFIYCSHVLEHVDDDLQVMREFHRVLSPEGVAFLLVPITAEETFGDPTVTDPEERLRLFGQRDHVRRYGPDYPKRLEEARFNVEKIEPQDFLSNEEIEKMAITKAAGELYICRKS